MTGVELVTDNILCTHIIRLRTLKTGRKSPLDLQIPHIDYIIYSSADSKYDNHGPPCGKCYELVCGCCKALGRFNMCVRNWHGMGVYADMYIL